jgi:hypothetical protein
MAAAPDIGEIGEILQEDLDALEISGPSKILPEIQRLRHTHHAIARYMAIGLKDVEICRITGYKPATLSMLKRGQAFRDLVESYKEMAESQAFDLQRRIHFIGDLTLDRIQQRLENDESCNATPLEHLRRLSVDLLDRDGYTPVKRSINLNIGRLDAEQLAAIKARAEAEEVEHERLVGSHSTVSTVDSGAGDGSVPAERALAEGAEADGDES